MQCHVERGRASSGYLRISDISYQKKKHGHLYMLAADIKEKKQPAQNATINHNTGKLTSQPLGEEDNYQKPSEAVCGIVTEESSTARCCCSADRVLYAGRWR